MDSLILGFRRKKIIDRLFNCYNRITCKKSILSEVNLPAANTKFWPRKLTPSHPRYHTSIIQRVSCRQHSKLPQFEKAQMLLFKHQNTICDPQKKKKKNTKSSSVLMVQKWKIGNLNKKFWTCIETRLQRATKGQMVLDHQTSYALHSSLFGVWAFHKNDLENQNFH